MVLIYCYIRKYKNFVQQEFNFHKDYRVSFSEDEETLSISRCEPDPIQKALFAEHYVEGLQLLVGKTGSGKTNLFQLLGELDEYRQGKQTEHPMLDRNSWAPHTQNALTLFLSRHSVYQYAVNRCIFKGFFLQRIISFSRSSQLWQQIGNKDFTRGRRLRFFIP